MILVTGANGLVGSHLITKLLQQGRQVKALYRNSHLSITHQNLIWVQGDILDVMALEEVMANVLQVYHCAAIVSFNPKEREQLFKTNVEGTANVVNACLNAGIDKLLFVSSVAAIGKGKLDEPIDETMKWMESNNNSAYGKTKHLAEMEVWRGIGEGLNAVIVNPSIILGAGDWTKGSVGIFKSVYTEFPWYSKGVNGFVDVADVINVMVQLMDSNVTAERFIVSGHNVEYKDLFTQIAIHFNRRPPYKKATPLLGEIVWRLEAVKAKFTGQNPLLTKETAHTAQAKVFYNNCKLLKALSSFRYTNLDDTLKNICQVLAKKYQL